MEVNSKGRRPRRAMKSLPFRLHLIVVWAQQSTDSCCGHSIFQSTTDRCFVPRPAPFTSIRLNCNKGATPKASLRGATRAAFRAYATDEASFTNLTDCTLGRRLARVRAASHEQERNDEDSLGYFHVTS